MNFSLQPTVQNDLYLLRPLKPDDFEDLLEVASDPEIWSQHPNKDRYRREVFANFFEGALQSGGAFVIIEKSSGEFLGSTRFYDFDADKRTVLIGYTFYATRCWGKNINFQIKSLMLDYIFGFAERVHFHVGKENYRSRRAMEKLGAVLLGEQNIAYFGEAPKLNVIFEIQKADWQGKNQRPEQS